VIDTLLPCTIGMEACFGAHHWGRLFQAHGHTVKLMAPKFAAPHCLAGKEGQERRGRCRSDLRGGAAPEHALCPNPSTRRPTADTRSRRWLRRAIAPLLATTRTRLPVLPATTAHVGRQLQDRAAHRPRCQISECEFFKGELRRRAGLSARGGGGAPIGRLPITTPHCLATKNRKRTLDGARAGLPQPRHASLGGCCGGRSRSRFEALARLPAVLPDGRLDGRAVGPDDVHRASRSGNESGRVGP
jgi:hypothetical protein